MSDEAARDVLVERMFGATIHALDLVHIYVGDKLGLYRCLAESGPLTTVELAKQCAIDERYAREWTEHQAVAGILRVALDGSGGTRQYELPAGHAEVLLDENSLSYMAPLASLFVGAMKPLDQVLAAFRTGAGVEYADYGEDLRRGIARINRPMFLNLLAQEWFPQVPGLADRLGAQPPARVADVGCGSGWSSIAIALGYPAATVTGLDLDEASIVEARANAAANGVEGRITFENRNAADPGLAGTFDLVCAFETIHDMNDPVGALRAMRGLRAEGGTVLVADERVADEFTTEVEDGERFQWGFSALHCLPTARTAPPAMGTGTVMRTPTFRAYALEAGFTEVEVLPIENDFWRFYRLVG